MKKSDWPLWVLGAFVLVFIIQLGGNVEKK